MGNQFVHVGCVGCGETTLLNLATAARFVEDCIKLEGGDRLLLCEKCEHHVEECRENGIHTWSFTAFPEAERQWTAKIMATGDPDVLFFPIYRDLLIEAKDVRSLLN